MNPNTPNIIAVVSAVVLLLNTFAGTQLASEEIQAVVSAVMVLMLAGSSVWSWLKTRGLVRQNQELSASLSAARFAAKAKK